MRSIASILLLFFLVCNFSIGQNIELHEPPSDNTKIEFRWMKPFLAGSIDLSFPSAIYDLAVSIPISDKLNIYGSVPFSIAKVEDFEGESDTGNLEIGIQKQLGMDSINQSSISISLFAPTASENAIAGIGTLTNFYEFHKYLDDFLSLYGNYRYQWNWSTGSFMALEVGPNIAIATSDDVDTELLLHYGVNVGHGFDFFTVNLEVNGITILTDDTDSFGDRFVHALGLGGRFTGGKVQPGLFYKLYLNSDFSDSIDGVLGINIGFAID